MNARANHGVGKCDPLDAHTASPKPLYQPATPAADLVLGGRRVTALAHTHV